MAALVWCDFPQARGFDPFTHCGANEPIPRATALVGWAQQPENLSGGRRGRGGREKKEEGEEARGSSVGLSNHGHGDSERERGEREREVVSSIAR